MNNSTSIRGAVIIVGALCVAVWLGFNIVTNQSDTLLQFAASILLLTCIFLGRRIWLLLILFWALNIPLIRGISTTQIGQGLFVSFTLAMLLMKRQPMKVRFGELEFWMFLTAACVAQVYARNPAGLGMIGSGTVGALPYFTVSTAFVAACFLSNIEVKPSEIKWAMRLAMAGLLLGPSLTAFRMAGGNGTLQIEVAQNNTLGDAQGSGRNGFLGEFGISIARLVTTYVSPLRGLLRPLWAPLIVIGMAAAAGSGFRTMVATVGVFYLIGIAYRGGFSSVLAATFSCVIALGVLALVNLAAPLPPNVQRALSPFPGTWEKRHVDAASGTTEWRLQMWKEALFTDYWINNKVFGDGLGFSKRELELMQSIESGSNSFGSFGSGMSQQQESMMINGGYHSGPVQCIRTIGYVGLLVVLCTMARVAVHAHRQIVRCKGTEWFPVALLFGIQTIATPIIYVFVFGDFARDVSATLMGYGMVRLLEKNLPLPAYIKTRRMPFVLRTRRIPTGTETAGESAKQAS